jgi:hypothetical protein
MSFMSNHVIHVKSCHSFQILSFMSNHVIHVKSCHSCQIMSFMSNHAIHDFSRNSVKSGGGRGVKYVFLSLRRQLCCLAEGKNRNRCHAVMSCHAICNYLILLTHHRMRKQEFNHLNIIMGDGKNYRVVIQ